MKKIVLLILLAMVVNGLYGQTYPENQWLHGTWRGIDGNNNSYEFIFNENGTGRSGGIDIIYSVNENMLTIFSVTGTSLRTNITMFRINESRIVFFFRSAGSEFYVNLNKLD